MFNPLKVRLMRAVCGLDVHKDSVFLCGKFNIEVQSVDRCNLNNLYLKTPRDQGTRPPINDFAWQKKLAMHKKKKRENAFSLKSIIFALPCTNI